MTGSVVIGRNEGERLESCLRSIQRECLRIVYVDSGSSDGSVLLAKSMGVEIVELDPSHGLSMARARNAGWKKLLERWPEITHIQFIDGDCELVQGWISKGEAFLESNPEFVVVCGRRRERFPRRSIFNWLCDIEWNTPIGAAKSCGGEALIRRSALEQVGGYEETLIAGEEPEMCHRMRLLGWKVQRLDGEMSVHDANILHWSQWWKRCIRTGYGAANLVFRGSPSTAKEGFPFQHLVESAIQWVTIWITGLSIACFWLLVGWKVTGSLILCGVVALSLLQSLRIARTVVERAGGFAKAFVYGIFMMLAKVPEFLGIWKFHNDFNERRHPQLIEYKS